MAKFKIGDRVQMSGVPFVVEVLEIGECEEGSTGDNTCDMGGETFRFKDPGGQGDDWAHSAEFEKVA
jgi:hypothetical protein